jgi:preprotein translocase subunit SecY
MSTLPCWRQYFEPDENTVLGLYNVMSGGAFSEATIFALSIQPYINASIIIQLLAIAIPAAGAPAEG